MRFEGFKNLLGAWLYNGCTWKLQPPGTCGVSCFLSTQPNNHETGTAIHVVLAFTLTAKLKSVQATHTIGALTGNSSLTHHLPH